MKKIVVYAALLTLCSCGGKTGSANVVNDSLAEPKDTIAEAVVSTPATDTEETVVERVREIYNAPASPDVFTQSFNNLMAKVNKFDEGAELGYIDHDILTQAQDYATIEAISVTDITATTAIARIKTNFSLLTVSLVKENGIWKVDDVNNERKAMEKYLAQ